MPGNNNSSIYEVQNLVKEYNGRQVLNVPALSFDRGRIYCLYGPNGSGKSTLFKVLTLLEKPTSGRILFNSKEIFPGDFGLNFMRSSVTLVQQNPLLFNTTVEKNVAYGLMVRNTGAKKKKQRVKECLEFVGLDGFQERKACEISGGEAQRVAIARAIAVDPDLIFLDEFSANIDSKNREVVENIVLKLNRQYSKTIVFTTHYKDQAYRLSDNVIKLVDGRVVEPDVKNIFHGSIKQTSSGHLFENSKIKLFVSSDKTGTVVVRVPVNVITVSKSVLESSIRNSLKGFITGVYDTGTEINLTVDTGDIFKAAITRESLNKMELKNGDPVWLNIKASSIEVF